MQQEDVCLEVDILNCYGIRKLNMMGRHNKQINKLKKRSLVGIRERHMNLIKLIGVD